MTEGVGKVNALLSFYERLGDSNGADLNKSSEVNSVNAFSVSRVWRDVMTVIPHVVDPWRPILVQDAIV